MNNSSTIEATANQSKKTFTIRKFTDNKIDVKYRTNSMNKNEFEEFEFYTENDLQYYLRTSNDYYLVKSY